MRTAAIIEAWLQELSDSDLDAVLRDWQVPQDTATLAAAAKWMNEPAALDRMLSRTTATDLAALRSGDGTPALAARGLHPDDALRARIPASLELHAPDASEQREDTSPAVDAAAMSVMRLSGAVSSMADQPVRLSGRGIPLAAELRFRSSELGIEIAEWERLLAAALHYRFIAPLDRELCASDTGVAWLDLAPQQRWEALRELFLAELSLSERAFLDQGMPSVEQTLPLADAATLEQFRALLERATLLGLALDGRITAVSPEQIAQHIPAPIDYVYLQPDQTLVAPGPLSHSAARDIAEMAVSEARGMASTWRLTPASLHSAMARGRTAEELLERLHRLSQTGVPQPVEYLLRDAERRFGAVQVTEGETATVRTDGDTAKRLLVDRALTAIELRVPTGRAIEEGVLHSASSSDVVLDKLVEERYPALLVDAEGAPVVSERRIATVSGRAPLSNLTERLRGLGVEVSSMQPDWLQAQLIAAVKSKMPVRVTVASGTQVQHATLVPLSVSNGRLRGRDLERDLERTLPLRAIVEVAGLQNA